MSATELDSMTGRAGRAIVGRTRELDRLCVALGEAIAGRGRLVLVGGEPGIGKTRLAEELAGRAGADGASVLWGRCWAVGGAPAYWPWVQILRAYVRDRPRAKLADELGASAPFVAHLVPELRDRLPDVPDMGLPTASEEARFAVLDAVTEFLSSASAAAPLVLVFDDLHAADASSLLLLRFLARELAATRILVVGTYRDMGAAPAPDVARLLSELAPAARHTTLRGLVVDDVARFVQQATGSVPGAEAAAAMHAATGGNPLFLLHLVQLLADEGTFPLDGSLPPRVPLPPGVREAIGARIAGLPGAAVDTLTIAAVIGDEPSVPLLREVSGLDRELLVAYLAAAVNAGLLVGLADGRGRVRFAHALIREALYEALDPASRLRLHRDVGQAIERLYEAEPGLQLATLAHHFCRAAPTEDAERGVGYAVRAAERAMALLAYEDAAKHYELALQTLEVAEGPQLARRGDILLGLAAAEQRAGRAERSRELFTQAAALARELGDAQQLARAAVGFGAAEATVGEVDEPAVELLEEALAGLPAEERALRARVLARLARALSFGEASARRSEHSRHAVEIARRSGDEATLLEALCAEHVVTWGPDNVGERLRSATEIVELAERLGDREAALQGRLWRRRHLLEVGEALSSDHETGVCERMARELRQPRYLWQAKNLEAGRALLAGRFAGAERLAREALEIGREGRGATAEATFLLQMRIICAEQGRLGEVAPQIERLAELHDAWRIEPLYHLVKLDRRGEVQALFERLAAHDFAEVQGDMFALWSLAYLAEACAYLGDRRRAALLYDLLLPYRERCLVMGQSGGCAGALARYLGQLAATLERWEDAADHFERALEIHIRLGARPLLAHTRHEYAAALLERGRPEDRERADAMLAQALGAADELGMTVLAERIRARGASPRTQIGVFRKEGEYWTIAFHGSDFRLKGELGLAYLAYLLARPNEQVHALELAAVGYPRASGAASPTWIDQPLATPRLGLGDAGELLDPQAKAAYRGRLADLREQLDQAQAWGDPERAAKLSAEIDFLTQELARAVGLRDHDRKAAAPAERARVSVTKAIRRAGAKVAAYDPRLGDHLSLTIRTGTFCSYTPGLPGTPTWETSQAPAEATRSDR
jgi:tetratricopeptide (TPR) repeat protein